MAHPTECRSRIMNRTLEEGDVDGRVNAATDNALRECEGSVDIFEAEIQ